MKDAMRLIAILMLLLTAAACGTSGEVVKVTTVTEGELKGLGEKNLAQLKEIKEAEQKDKKDDAISQFIEGTPSYSIQQYLDLCELLMQGIVRQLKTLQR